MISRGDVKHTLWMILESVNITYRTFLNKGNCWPHYFSKSSKTETQKINGPSGFIFGDFDVKLSLRGTLNTQNVSVKK